MNKFPFGGFNHLILKEFCLGFLSYYGYISFRDFNHLLLKEFHSGFLSFLWIHFLSGISIIIFLKEFRLGLLVSAGAFVDALDGGGCWWSVPWSAHILPSS